MAVKESVPVTIPATTAHRQFGDLVRRAFSGKEHFIVEKDGLPVVAIISMAEYEELLREREARAARLKQFQSATRAIGEEYERRGLTEEEVLAQLEETKHEVYEEYYGDKSTK
jgi:prevent-host-death family protein